MTVAMAAVIVMLTGMSASATTTGSQPPNSVGIRLAEIPEARANDPRATSSILDHVIPGATVSRRVELVSTVSEPVTVAMVGVGAEIDDGVFRPLPDGERGVGDWISIRPEAVELAANGAETVLVEIAVPASTPTGEYYGIVFAEPPSSGSSVAMTNRVGVRVYLSVGSGDEPPVDFEIGEMTAGRESDGTPYVATDLRNTGGRALDISGELSLGEGPAGLDAGPFPFEGVVTIAPGEIRELRFNLDPALPDGPWTAQLTAFSGLLQRTAEARISFPEDAGATTAPEETEIIGGTDADGNDISEELRQQRRTLLPIAALLILLALGGLFLLLWWQRRERDEDEESEVPAGVGRDDS